MNNFLAPRKSLGQNFLQDSNIIQKIVASLNIKSSDIVLEIGPGRGALTELILPLAGSCHLVEFDHDLVRYWQSRVAKHPNLIVHSHDILKFDLNEVLNASTQSIKVIGNLPYNISSPVLFHLMTYADRIESQIVMLQKEVVQRMASRPGNKQFGRLSVMLQQRFKIEHLFTVPPGAFFPPPKVDSAIARLTPLAQPDHPVDNYDHFASLVKHAFSQRRKTLRNTLKGVLDATQIDSIGIDSGARAETLSVANFTHLANLYTASQ